MRTEADPLHDCEFVITADNQAIPASQLPVPPDEVLPIAPVHRLWILRWLLRGGTLDRFVGELGFSSVPLAQSLGVMPAKSGRRRKFRPEDVEATLRRDLEALEADPSLWVQPEPLRSNIERLASVVNLSKVEQTILAFALQLHGVNPLTEAVRVVGSVARAKLARTLASILNIRHHDIRVALRSDGALQNCGLMQFTAVPSSIALDLSESLDFLSGDFVDVMLNGQADPINLLTGRVQLAPAPTLGLGAFERTVPALGYVVLPLLRGACDNPRKGMNFLFVGPPGLGKSEAARMLAAEVGATAYEVAFEDTDGNELTGSARVRAMKAGQLMLRGSRAVMIFDEASDVFITREGLAWTSHRDMPRKAFLNRALEDNHIPGIWISNAPPTDPAVLRRFCGVFEFTTPQEDVRRAMLTELFSPTISAQTAQAFARSPNLSMAVVKSACTAVECAGERLDPGERERVVHTLVASQLKVGFGEQLPPITDGASGGDEYDPALVNADHDLEALASALGARRRGRVLLAGPPGCGKTGFAAWVARRLGAPLQTVRMSSLLASFVGDTEKAISAAFERAESENAVLCFDEIEGLLRPRSRAERSYEVTQVDELLVALERFNGVLIASTNLFDENHIEPAALRRFDLIVQMRSATPDQLMELLRRYADLLGLDATSDQDFQRVRTLDLTPGDFHTMRQRARLLPFASTLALVEALEKTSCRKQPGGGKRAIGFTARVIAGA